MCVCVLACLFVEICTVYMQIHMYAYKHLQHICYYCLFPVLLGMMTPTDECIKFEPGRIRCACQDGHMQLSFYPNGSRHLLFE